MTSPRISLCMIAKDEEQMLPACLESVRGAVDEIVLVDTGSKDRTRDIARAAGARVFERPWRDFADARNAALEQATGEWILVLDADERLAPGAGAALRAHAAAPSAPLGLLRLHNASAVDATAAEVLSGARRLGPPLWLPRFLQHTPDLRYEGAIHEMVEAWAKRHGFRVKMLEADLVHLGEVPELRAARGKRKRNLELLRARCASERTNVTPFGYLAMELIAERLFDEAREVVERGWALVEHKPRWKSAQHLVTARTLLANMRQDPETALASLEAAEGSHRTSAEVHFLRGWARELLAYAAPPGAAERDEHLQRAEEEQRAAIALESEAALEQSLHGAARWLAWTRLGFVHLARGRIDEADKAFLEALARMPGHLEAMLGRGEVLLARRQPQAALELIETRIGEAPDAWVLASVAADALGARQDALAFLSQARSCPRPWVTPLWRARAARLAPAAPQLPASPATRHTPGRAPPPPPVVAGRQRWAVTTVSPPGYPHAAAFTEVAESLVWGLRALGHDAIASTDPALADRRHLLLGANLLPAGTRLQQGTVVYNLEQIEAGSPWLTPELLELYRTHELWDYSRANADALVRLGVPRPAVVPIGYAPVLTRIEPAPVEDIDVLFYGSINPRRRAVLESLAARGARVHAAFGVYGAERDALIARSKLVLNIHFFEAKVFEIVRVAYLLANGRCVVSERGANPAEELDFEDAVAFAPYPELVGRCMELLDDRDARARMAARGQALMRGRPVERGLLAALHDLPPVES